MKKRKTLTVSTPKPEAAATAAFPGKFTLLICGLLALAVIAIYAQTATHGYIAYDDDQYVYENPWVKAGLSASNIAWACTTFFYANWHPLTWISYLLDTSLFGANPGAEHLVNAAFHLGSTLLLFLALARMTGRPWRAALVAAIFGVHPLRVESVAWISERKDVLSTFFEMLTLLAYIRYAARPNLKHYLLVAGAFILSLLAKPMAVTFPLVLLLLDYWPLGRLRWPPARPVIVEKLPLLALSAAASVLTFEAQHSYGAVVSLTRMPLLVRAANAAIAYVAYIGKALWPANLAVLYPAHNLDASSAVLAVVVLAVLTGVAWFWREKRPYFAVGWLWYVGMLVPVIGLVQVGIQSMADRYTYLPMVGLSIALVWTVADLVAEHRTLRLATSVAAVAVLVVLSAVAFRQAAYWKSSQSLFEHTLAVTSNNHIIENNLGVILGQEGKDAEAMALYRSALATYPDYAEAHANLGHELLQTGKFTEAETHLNQALAIQPDLASPHGDKGVLFAARGQFDEACRELERALTLAPGNATNESNLCYALTHAGRPQEAIEHCNTALRIKPGLASATFNLTNAQKALGQK